MKIFILDMIRVTSKPEPHHYVEGVYKTKKKAIAAGFVEQIWRANKYFPNIIEMDLEPEIDQDKLNYALECCVDEKERNQVRTGDIGL